MVRVWGNGDGGMGMDEARKDSGTTDIESKIRLFLRGLCRPRIISIYRAFCSVFHFQDMHNVSEKDMYRRRGEEE